MSYDNLSSVSQNVLKFYHQLTGEERRIPFIFDGDKFVDGAQPEVACKIVVAGTF
jgi:hypothetical protein